MVMTISEIQIENYERVVNFSDDGFECFIAVHNTALGPALGGCRIKPYASKDDALTDVLRLAKGMTYKSSLAGLNLGGGKCVVVADKSTRDIMLKVGEAVNHLNGLYITAEDVGTTLGDIQIVGEVSSHIVHLDGSSNTARGVLACMNAAIQHLGHWGENLAGIPIWVQGLGKVGYDLVERLAAVGAGINLSVSDLRSEIVQRACTAFPGVREVTEDDKKFVSIYSPCAMGQVVAPDNVNAMRYSIICGSANNQLLHDEYAEILQTRDILYCPDFLANAGGVITAAGEVEGWTDAEVEDRCDRIGDVLKNLLAVSKEENVTPLAAANLLAESRLK